MFHCSVTSIHLHAPVHFHATKTRLSLKILITLKKSMTLNDLSIGANGVRQLNVIQNYSYYKGKNESLYSI